MRRTISTNSAVRCLRICLSDRLRLSVILSVCVFLTACVSVCMCVFVCVLCYGYVRMCVYLPVYAYMSVCMPVCVSICLCMYVCMSICLYVCLCVYVCMSVCVDSCLYVVEIVVLIDETWAAPKHKHRTRADGQPSGGQKALFNWCIHTGTHTRRQILRLTRSASNVYLCRRQSIDLSSLTIRKF